MPRNLILSRPRDDSRTIEMMNELTAGRVPQEMQGSNVNGRDVEVVLIDKQDEIYEAPFGSENWRGGAKGSFVGKAGDSSEGIYFFSFLERYHLTIFINGLLNILSGEFCMDEVDDEEVLVDSSPSTTIQLKWIDGSKMKMKVNHSHTVRDILRLLKKRTTTNTPFLLR